MGTCTKQNNRSRLLRPLLGNKPTAFDEHCARARSLIALSKPKNNISVSKLEQSLHLCISILNMSILKKNEK